MVTSDEISKRLAAKRSGIDYYTGEFCGKCGSQNPENAKFCFKCGSNLTEHYFDPHYEDYNHQPDYKCPYCYKPLHINTKKCSGCGEWLVEKPKDNRSAYCIGVIIFWIIIFIIRVMAHN